MLVRVFTAYPEYFDKTLDISLLGKTKRDGLWSLEIVNLRDFGLTKHKKIDDTRYGGGRGLILRPDVLSNALVSKIHNIEDVNDNDLDSRRVLAITSPRGVKFSQKIAGKLSKIEEFNIICNRFEGVDQRVIDFYKIQEISIGDYILLGGEVAVSVILESTLRLIDGFLPVEITENESFSGENEDFIEHSHYTKPEIWNGLPVPAELTSGNHKLIKKWQIDNLKMIKND